MEKIKTIYKITFFYIKVREMNERKKNIKTDNENKRKLLKWNLKKKTQHCHFAVI